jgi:hypothetical protein
MAWTQAAPARSPMAAPAARVVVPRAVVGVELRRRRGQVDAGPEVQRDVEPANSYSASMVSMVKMVKILPGTPRPWETITGPGC